MIVHDHQQGSIEWLHARLGVVSASNMHRVVNESGELRKARSGPGLAQGADTYLNELVVEYMLGEPVNVDANQYMQRGTGMEEEAAAWFAWEYETPVITSGFITTDCGRVGASPDRLVGDDGLLEIKCPSAVQHVANLRQMTSDYLAQVQTQLFVTGRDWVDLLSYNPAMPKAIKRFERNGEFIANLQDALFGPMGFLERFENVKASMHEKGFKFPAPACAIMTVEGQRCGSTDGVTDVDGVWTCQKCDQELKEVFG
jgi:hypothetical protein